MSEERNCYNCGHAAIAQPTEAIPEPVLNIFQLEIHCTIQEWKAGFDFEDPGNRCLGKVIPPGQSSLPCRHWTPRT